MDIASQGGRAVWNRLQQEVAAAQSFAVLYNCVASRWWWWFSDATSVLEEWMAVSDLVASTIRTAFL